MMMLQQDKWQPLLNTVAHVQKYRWLKHNVRGIFSQSSLMGTIVEFALKEEPLDVEKMRKCLLKQVFQMRNDNFQMTINYIYIPSASVSSITDVYFSFSWREPR